MKLFSKIAAGALLSIALSVSAFAGPINGSEVVNFGGVRVSADNITFSATGDLLTANYIEFTDISRGTRAGDFASDTTGTISTGPIVVNLTGGIGSNTFTINGGTWGVFLSQELVFDAVIGNTRGIGLRNVTTTGAGAGFIPGSNQLAGANENSASFLISLTQSGGVDHVISGSATLNTPALMGTPEPATMALIGSALFGLGFIRRRKLV